MYAVIASHEKDVRWGEEKRRVRKREDTRPKENLIPAKRLELPIAYLTEAIELASVHLQFYKLQTQSMFSNIQYETRYKTN